MDDQAPRKHIDSEDARAGSTPHIVRYVLAISLFLAIVALSIIWMTGALTANEEDRTEINQPASTGQPAG